MDTARTPAQLGALIQRARKSQQLTQAELGAAITRRQATISNLENGEPGTELGTLFDVLTALNLEITVSTRGQKSSTDIESIF